jgi:hypothetical protein
MRNPFLHFLFFIFLFFLQTIQGQGSNLLIQQYNRGPALGQSYSKFSFKVGPQLNRINTDLGTTSPTLALGGLFEIEYHLSKNVSLVSGGQYTPIRYRYLEKETTYQDLLNYINFPLFLRLQPAKKLGLGLGTTYQLYLKGEKKPENQVDQETTLYPKGIFKNSLGLVTQLSFSLNPFLDVFVNYRWVRRTSPPLQKETNNTQGLQLGVSCRIFQIK